MVRRHSPFVKFKGIDMRGAFAKSQLYPAFPWGGVIGTLTINDATWTEYDPQDADLVAVQIPPVDGGRVVYTNSATHADLTDGMAVTPLHLQRSWDVYPGQIEVCTDRNKQTPVRFFFAVADVLDTEVDLLFMRAAS